MREIPLTHGFVALVDDDDYAALTEHTWSAKKARKIGMYAACQINRKYTLMHRFILGATAGVDIDHINRNGLDNRKCNLRQASKSQNAANAKKHTGHSSQYKGVTLKRTEGKWWARITFHRRDISLGCYANELDAARAYDAKARELFGEFARLNFPSEP